MVYYEKRIRQRSVVLHQFDFVFFLKVTGIKSGKIGRGIKKRLMLSLNFTEARLRLPDYALFPRM
jgi:hypothetical protein